jgi:hypothetical protein
MEDQELMSQGKNFGLHCYARSEDVSNRREQREDDREHGIGKPIRRRGSNTMGSTRKKFLVGTSGCA